MATRIESVRNLVGTQSIAFIRPINLTLTLNGARPSTPMNVFFDGVMVNELCTTSLITSDTGGLTTILQIPGGRFTTGEKQIVVTDAAALSQLNVTGSTFGSGIAKFTSTGTLQLFQTTTTTTTTVTVTENRTFPVIVPVPTRTVDPIAQSFFTYGVKGGLFVTAIELFFNSKDATIPVKVDIRPMENGYPVKFGPENPDWVVIKPASEINISTNATVGTRFEFATPVYLQEDKDYCFVVFSNSKNYNLYTSRVGENSLETGRRIFQQPYVGSLFKSENNVTWVAEQFEDIKFTIYQAQFSTNVSGTVALKATSAPWAVPGSHFRVMSTSGGNSTIRVQMTTRHGLNVTSSVIISTSPNALYRGIAATNFGGTRTVTNVIDEYTFEYISPATASSTGTIVTGGQVTNVEVVSGGNGYSSPPTITFSGGGATTQATATAVVRSGSVVKITLLTPGVGYTSEPTITISGTGLGASARAMIDAMFSVHANGTATMVAPDIPSYKFSGTTLDATISTTRMAYEDNDVTYNAGETTTFNTNARTNLPSYSVIASAVNETLKLAGTPSMLVRYNMSTTNPNVSPIIDLRDTPNIIAYTHNLRSQRGENSTGTSDNTFISSFDVLTGGSGYITQPDVTVSGGGAITQATAVAVLGTSTISSTFDIVSGGQYRLQPTLSFSGGGGSGAAATAVLATASVDTTYTLIVDGGAGYTNPPTLSFVNGDLAPGGTNAVATAAVSGGVITNVTISSGGSRYRQIPDILITPDPLDTITEVAEIKCRLLPRAIMSVALTDGGSGYTLAPTVTVNRAVGDDLTATASITAQLSGKSIERIDVVTPGAGYTSVPAVTVTRAPSDPSGIDAIAVAVLDTSYNSEVGPTSGSNLSRYITKRISLETPSTGITLFSEIYSEIESSVDWYIRTSVSGTEIAHTTLNWIPLKCDQQRNRSSKPDEKFDYKFYLYDLPAFDTYDLKCVMRSSNPVKAPKVYNYRVIIVA